jgi:hypothetical protein
MDVSPAGRLRCPERPLFQNAWSPIDMRVLGNSTVFSYFARLNIQLPMWTMPSSKVTSFRTFLL